MINWYRTKIFPKVLLYVLDSSSIRELRKTVLAKAQGNILEIGLGPGMNLPFYPEYIEKITALDIVHMEGKHLKPQVEFVLASLTQTPFPDNTFDTIVSTFNLCSLPTEALPEIKRILKPEGNFLFLEHGLSKSSFLRFFQHLFTPFFYLLGCGCHLNRNHQENMEKAGFKLKEIHFIPVPMAFSFLFGELYTGIATK